MKRLLIQQAFTLLNQSIGKKLSQLLEAFPSKNKRIKKNPNKISIENEPIKEPFFAANPEEIDKF